MKHIHWLIAGMSTNPALEKGPAWEAPLHVLCGLDCHLCEGCWATGETRLKAVLPLDGHIFEGQMAFLAEVEIQEE